MKNEVIEKYPVSMRLFHWVTVIFVLTLLTVGFVMSSMKPSPDKWQLYFMHKSFGLLFFLLIIARIINRYKSKLPATPSQFSPLEAKLSKIAQYSMYALLVFMPIAGGTMSVFSGKGLPFFFTTFLASVEKNADISGFFWLLHTNIPFLLIAIITLHILGVLKYIFIDKYNIIRRMV